MNILIVALGIKSATRMKPDVGPIAITHKKIPTKNSFACPFREIDKLCELVPIAKRS